MPALVPQPDPTATLLKGQQLAALAAQHPDIPSFAGRPAALLQDLTRTYTGQELRQLIGGGKTWKTYRPYFVTRAGKAERSTGNKIGRFGLLLQLDPTKVQLIKDVIAGRKVAKILDKRDAGLKKAQLKGMKAKTDLLLALLASGEDPQAAIQLALGNQLRLGEPQVT